MNNIERSMMNVKVICYYCYGLFEVMVLELIEEFVLVLGQVWVSLWVVGVVFVDIKLWVGLLQGCMELLLLKVLGCDGVGVIVVLVVEGFYVGQVVCVIVDMLGQGIYVEIIVFLVECVVVQFVILLIWEVVVLLQLGVSVWIFIFRMVQVQCGMKVLVYVGLGVVGSLMVRLVMYLGVEVWVICSSVNKDDVLVLGVVGVIVYDMEDFLVLWGFDVVFDLVGGNIYDCFYFVFKLGG